MGGVGGVHWEEMDAAWGKCLMRLVIVSFRDPVKATVF